MLRPSTKEQLQEILKDDSINLADIDTSLIIDMSGLFNDSKRKDFSGINTWDTSKVTDMSMMFFSCSYFNEELSFDTSSVTNMDWMFSNCVNFNKQLNFDTSKITSMQGMFYECSNLEQTFSFDMSKVTNDTLMFFGSKAKIVQIISI